MKDDILNLLKQDSMGKNLNEIYSDFKEKKSRSLILHYLNQLVSDGLIKRHDNKVYSYISTIPINGENLNVSSLETIVVPKIIAKCGNDDKLIDDNNIEQTEIALNKNSYKSDDLILVEVSGDSMSPTFNDGQLLLFRRWQSGEKPNNMDIILARVEDGAKVKRYNSGLLLSDNPENNKPIKIDDDNFQPLGRFVSVMS